MLIAFLALFCCQVNAQIIFVQQDATGNGTSWDNSLGSLTEALNVATEGTQIWVANGIYAPQGDDRNATFNIPNGVQVFGGFTGTESSVEQRDLQNNRSVLTGEIAKPGIMDNAFTVVTFEKVNATTQLDGFIISEGNANSDDSNVSGARCGGGMYVDGTKGASTPVIQNCVFEKNFGRDGAAVYNNGRGGESSPTFVNCVFQNNEAGLDGGAIYNDGRKNGKSNPLLSNCTFERNMGTYGGAICNATETGACNLVMENCNFIENAAYLRGGAIFSMNGDQKCYLEMSGCQFSGNFPDDQNMVFTSSNGRSNAYQIARSEP